MSSHLVEAYVRATGKKLPYLVPESHFDHPLYGPVLSRTPRSRAMTRADMLRPTPPTPAALASGSRQDRHPIPPADGESIEKEK